MQRDLILLWPSFIMAMSACSNLAVSPAKLDKWLAEQQYDKALSAIAKVPEQDTHYQALKERVPEIQKQRQQKVTSILRQAATYAQSLDWVNAKGTISEGLQRFPDEPELLAKRQHYQQMQDARLERDRANILVSQARYIIDARPYWQSELYNGDLSGRDKRGYHHFIEQASEVSEQLFLLGEQYWQAKKVNQATATLNLAQQTAKNEKVAALLAVIAEFKRKKAIESGQLIELDSESTKLEQSFLEKLRNNDFAGAQYILNEMAARELPLIEQKQALLAQQKKEAAEALTARGNQLYNSGNIKAAIQQWQKALALHPDDPSLQQQLERAKRFLDNLERWKSD